MSRTLTHLVMFFILMAVSSVSADLVWADSVSSDQLTINKAALLTGAQPKIRLVAAKQLLIADDPKSRNAIIEALGAAGDIEARKAICSAIIQSDSWQKKISNLKDLIEPLCSLMKSKDASLVELASQALLVYDYAQVSQCLLSQITPENELQTRLNVIVALKQRMPQREVITTLVDLLDDETPEIADASGLALQDWFPLGTDRKFWGQIISELSEKSPQQIVRERFIRQQSRLMQLESLYENLLSDHVDCLDMIYQAKTDDKARTDFLMENFHSEFAPVRVWAIDKVAQWRNSASLPVEFSPILLDMVNDDDPAVRLKVAQLLIYMADINPAASLLDQLKIESDKAAARAQLNALGEACYYASLSSSQFKLDPAIRITTLSFIDKFIQSDDPQDVLAGADNLRKILEKNGLDNGVVQNSLKVLLAKYVKSVSANSELPAKLLERMARLCESSCFFKSDASSLYNNEFLKALGSGDAAMRYAAVAGLKNVDSAAALKEFKQKELYNDSDQQISNIVIELASEVGRTEDLEWLFGKMKSADSQVWPAILSILQRSEPEIVSIWLDKLVDQLGQDPKVVDLLEMAQKKTGLQTKARIKLAQLYKSRFDFENSQKYYNLASEVETDQAAIDQIKVGMLDLYLIFNKNYEVSKLVSDRLEITDISDSDPYAQRLDRHFHDNKIEASQKAMLLALLAVIRSDSPRPAWDELLYSWKMLIGGQKLPPLKDQKPSTAAPSVMPLKDGRK